MTTDISGPAPLGDITIACVDDDYNTFPARITSLDARGIVRAMVPRRLPEGKRVQVHAGSAYSVTGIVLYSVGSDTEQWVTIKIDQDDQRRAPRIAVNAKASVVSLCANLMMNAEARVTDVSKSGLGLITDQRIPKDILLKITLDGAIIFAETQYCEQAGGAIGYKVGAEIQTVILHGEAEPDWMHTPEELWGALDLASRRFHGNS